MCLGIPGQILSINGENPVQISARVRFGEIVREVQLSLLPDAKVGDYVIVHAGFAISQIDESEAHQRMELIRQLVPDEDLP